MANRLDYFFKQPVTEAELDLGFKLLEDADRLIVADLGLTGVISGGVATEHSPVADLTVDLTGPFLSHSPQGERVAYVPAQTVDLSIDNLGASTDPPTPTFERIVSLFVKFDRTLSDPRLDGASQTIFFNQAESFKFFVTQGAEAAPGTPTPPPLEADGLLLADVTLTSGQTQILNADLDTARRQEVNFGRADQISVVDNFPNILSVVTDVQETLEALAAADQTIIGKLLIGRTAAPTAGFALEVDAVSPEFIHLHDPSTELVAGKGTGLHLAFTAGATHLLVADIVDLDSFSLDLSGAIAPPTQGKGHIRADMYSGHAAAAQTTPKMHLLATTSAPRLIDFFSGPVGAKVFDTKIKVGELETQLSGGIKALLGNIVATVGDLISTAGKITALGLVQGSGFVPINDVRNSTLDALEALRLNKGQLTGAVARVDAAGALVGANDVNVASITDNGTGDHTVNFDRNHNDADYIVQVSLDGGGAGRITVGTTAVGSVQVLTFDTSDVAADRAFHLTTVGVLV